MDVDQRAVQSDPALARDYLGISRSLKSAEALERTALRTRSRAARDLLAEAAAPGTGSAADLLTALRASRNSVRSPVELDPTWGITLARVIGMQNLDSTDVQDAALLLTELHRQHGRSIFVGEAQQTVVDRLWQAGERDLLSRWLPELDELAPSAARYLQADLTNPFHDGADGQSSARGDWQRLVDSMFTEHGIEPVRIADGAETPFDGLTCAVGAAVTSGPLVTVIISAYCPGPGLLTSVRSICNQTWRNLEILIVDDASPPEYSEVLDACAEMDPRVRVHRMERNGGTYTARNMAMDIASGEIVTCQDSDDWSHPRRIELQVRPLLDDPGVSSTRSYCFRVKEDLTFQRPGYDPTQAHAASLMFRREQALAAVGYFDNARKAADTEYRMRLELVTGATSVDLKAPLAMYRMGSGSLSRADFTPGWHHVSRWVYRCAYAQWHALIARGADPWLPRIQDERRFAIPQRFQIDQQSCREHPPEYDVVVLSDWRLHGTAQQDLLAEIDVLAGAGYRVGVAHGESYRHVNRRRLPLSPAIVRRMNAGVVDFVALDQAAVASLLVIRSPEILQFVPEDASTLEVGRVVVVADECPADDGGAVLYIPATCDAAVGSLFAAEATWVPSTSKIRSLLASEIPADRLHSVVPTDFLDIDGTLVRRPERTDRPTVGSRLRGGGSGGPEQLDEVLNALVAGNGYDVRLRAAFVSAGADGTRSEESAWIRYAPDELTQRQFVAQLDFYVDFSASTDSPAVDRDVLLAIASGCVTVLPAKLEPIYGDAAVYADAHEVPGIIQSFHCDRAAYHQRSQHGVAALRARFGPASRLAGIAELVGPPAGGGEPRETAAAQQTAADPSTGVPLVVLVNNRTASKLAPFLRQLAESDHWHGAPVTVVHTPRAQLQVDDAVAEHPWVSFAVTAGNSPVELASLAADCVLRLDDQFVCVAGVPSANRFASWTLAVQQEVARLSELGLESSVPILVWTDQCPQHAIAAYIHDALVISQPAPGAFSDYLGGLAIAGGDPRLEATDPGAGELSVLAWLNAKFLANMPQPTWRYRVTLTRTAGGDSIRSEPIDVVERVDSRARWTWEEARGLLPLRGVRGGTYAFDIEVDTEVQALRVRRRLRPAKGLLFDSRTMTLPLDAGAGTTLRYLCHTVGNGERSYALVQVGRGRLARLRWSASMLKKDLSFAYRGRRHRRMVFLRLLRLLTMPVFARRSIWLVGERTDTAQDNGYHLFRKIRAEHPDRSVYYVIDPASPQYSRVAHLGNVVAHSSMQHQLLMLHADVLANAYSIRHMIPASWYQSGYTRHLAWRIGSLRVYLKHGVHLNPNAFKRGMTGYDLLLTVMSRESEALRRVTGYDRQIREIGMPRYDSLEPRRGTRNILFMPTWRQYLTPRLSGAVNQDQMPMEGSDYEAFISGLLSSSRLHDLLVRYDFRLMFLPHYNIASFFDEAVAAADRVELADPNQTSFQDLLRDCDVFVTDYSSVHFDIAYMGTPVIYARFDEELYEARHASRSWFDYDRDGYGPVTRSLDETIDALEESMAGGCVVGEPYAARAARDFTFRDQQNTARVVAAIDELVSAGSHHA
ncbi:CDP-glycerol glycerophosphotransferase family protein [Pseudactinotalea sp.]|uniref:bifunctional glycosyltransferase/CDP-glycerol:glycerophosphate glycerophosphotransferase n=1 Tax=Pseudactinotalea sp. TaxID=1926260 RepID=UPI003B3A5CCD